MTVMRPRRGARRRFWQCGRLLVPRERHPPPHPGPTAAPSTNGKGRFSGPGKLLGPPVPGRSLDASKPETGGERSVGCPGFEGAAQAGSPWGLPAPRKMNQAVPPGGVRVLLLFIPPPWENKRGLDWGTGLTSSRFE